MSRPDATLIKHLAATHSAACAREWQRPPLVVLPGAEFVAHLIKRPSSDDLPPLIWDDAVYDLGELRKATSGVHRGYAWMRVRTMTRYLDVIDRSSPWMLGPADLFASQRRDAARWLVIEAWEDRTTVPGRGRRGLPLYPDVVLLGWPRPTVQCLYPNPTCRDTRAYGAGFCLLEECRHRTHIKPCQASAIMMVLWPQVVVGLLRYLARMPEYPVEVAPVAPAQRAARAAKTLSIKPWLREDLSHIILVDPSRVTEYGHPSATGQTHASPRPHQRRGHWRQLKHPRFGKPRTVFVRPAWVGDTQWEHDGQMYRVTTAAQ